MEFYLKELADTHKQNNNSSTSIEFRGEIIPFDTYDNSKYADSEQQQILEHFFYKYIDLMSDPILCNVIFNRLYAGNYASLSINVKSYLFETLELCSPQQFLPWIYQVLDNEDVSANINILAFTTYIDSKRKRGLTSGEIRYTIICEPSSKLLELILSKIFQDRLTSKHVWLAIFRLKQHLSMTSQQKDIFNDWLGVV